MDSLGQHTLIELQGCNTAVNDADVFREVLTEAAEAARVTLLQMIVHEFNPQGVTGLAVLAESHLALHSWPEHCYLAADIFTCGTAARPERIVPVLKRHFQPETVTVRTLPRGRAGFTSASR